MLDLGDFMSTDPVIGKFRNEFIFSIMEGTGTVAATLGPRELEHWDETRAFIDRGTIPYVTTNLKAVEDGVSRPLAYPYLIREVGGVKVGLLGVMGSTEFTRIDLPEGLDVVFEDPRDAILAILPGLRDEAEIVILMAHMDGRATEQLVGDVPAIDVALVGHKSRTEKTPRKVGDTVVNESGIRGQWAGVARLIVSTGGEILDWGGQNVALDAAVDPDSETQRLVDEHEQETQRLRKAGAEARRSGIENELALSRFLGAENCQGCHVSEHQQWLETAHAHAFQTLVDEGKETAAECVSCHVTGFGKPTGFKADLSEPNLRNVQCEACHGLGTEHGRGEDAATVTESLCLTCHDAENSPNFDYAEYLKAVLH